MIEEHYKPSQIRFRRSEIVWLIKNWVELWQGTWPVNPVGSGYVDIASIRKLGGKTKAPFITACDVAAEIDIRLDKCGIDGLLVKPYYCLGESAERLAKLAHCSPEQVERHIKRVLAYISGKWPKDRSYEEFKSHGRQKYGYSSNKGKAITIRGVSYKCPNCHRQVIESYNGEAKKLPHLHYWLRCPKCNDIVDVQF